MEKNADVITTEPKPQIEARGGQRDYTYDWLRLIATLFVVIGHSAYLNIQTTYGGVAYELPANLSASYNSAVLVFLRYLAGWAYGFHMPLFFMLSGAVLALRPLPCFDVFVKKKVRRLLIPYFVYGWCFVLPVKYLGNFYTKETLKQAMWGFLSGQDSGHLWFLTSLFWVLLIFAALNKLLIRLNLNSVYALLLICGILKLIGSYVPFDVLGLKTGIGYIFWFALGYAFQKERASAKPWNFPKTLIAFAVLLFLEMAAKKWGILDTFFTVVVGSFFTYIIADLISRIFKPFVDRRAIKFVMRNLFYVYLFHDPLEYIVLRLFIGQDWLASSAGCYLYSFSRIVLIFAIGLILGELVQRVLPRLSWILNGKDML